LTTAVSLSISDFDLLAGFTGAFGNNMLAFIFVPPLFIRLRQLVSSGEASTTKNVPELVLLGVLFVFGLCMLVMTTVQTIQHLIHQDSKPCGGIIN